MHTTLQRSSSDYHKSSSRSRVAGQASDVARKNGAIKQNISLSSYFPKGTHYFYGYPAGEDSGFLNLVPPSVEELVAARAISCAGAHVSVIGFPATHHPQIDQALKCKFNLPHINNKQLMLLPEKANANLVGTERNKFIKESLLGMIKDNNLVMAQPYISMEMENIYQIPTELITYLNDKNNMSDYISDEYLPERLGIFKNGSDFVKASKKFSFPFVVKAGSSSSGDGVYICANQTDLNEAIKNLRSLKGGILVEQFVQAVRNYGVHFGISYKSGKPIDFIGVNEQITTTKGEFIGGIINTTEFPEDLKNVQNYLKNVVLPKVKAMGWYGVGGFDVLTDNSGKQYFIDCNFRMTGMSAYHFLIANNVMAAPLLSFGGEFKGSQIELEQSLLPYANPDSPLAFMQLIALNRQEDTWNFNAAIFYNSHKQLNDRIRTLLSVGVSSRALNQLVA